jgi:hypothetical protein
VIARIEKDASHERMKEHHVLVRGGIEVEAIVRRAFPAAKFRSERSVLGDPAIQIAEPILAPLPDLRMIFHDGILVDGKRKQEIGMKMLYAGFHSY